MKKDSSKSQQLSEEQEKDFQLSAISSPHYQYYLAHMKPIDRQSQQFGDNLRKLKANGFQYNENYSFKFNKTIIKSSTDSVKYHIEYGCFKTFIYASFASYDFSMIKREYIGKGRFGTVLLFTYKQQLVVAKSISFEKFNSNQLESLLRQIFWAKFASILKIGPKFIKAYGYDFIIFRESCQYLMQYCENNLKTLSNYQILKSSVSRRIKDIVRTLHSLHAVYGDLKISHIAWSHKHKNVIILDFGMTDFYAQKVGEMTLTDYFGTFSYSCPEMKKAFFVKSPLLVDLYFNDLFAILKCEQFLLQIPQSSTEKNKLQLKESEWSLILILFAFKFQAFQQNIEECVKIYQKQQELVPCLQQVLKCQEKRFILRFKAKLWEQSKQFINFKRSQDLVNNKNAGQAIKIIYLELQKSRFSPKLLNFQMSEAFFKKLYESSDLQEFLKSYEAMESSFEYIFSPKQQLSQLQFNQKQKIVSYFFLSRNPLIADCSKQDMTHQIILMFQGYFYTTGNLKKLLQIEKIFRLTCQIKFLKAVQQNICEVFLKNVDLWLDYYRKGIAFLYNSTHRTDLFMPDSVRNSWEWLTTQKYLQQQFLQEKDRKFIECCANIIRQIDQSLSFQKLSLRYDKERLYQALKNYEKQLVFREGDKLNNFEIVTAGGKQQFRFAGLFYTPKQIKHIQYHLILGILRFYRSKQPSELLPPLTPLKYLLRETVWVLPYLFKIKDIVSFEKYLELCFENVFIADMCHGICMFTKFISMFDTALKQENLMINKTKQMVINFLGNIKTAKILDQIKDDGYSLKNFVRNSFKIITMFRDSSFRKKTVIQYLDIIIKDMFEFFASNNNGRWLVAGESEIFILLQIIQVYYSAFKNDSWENEIEKMMDIAKKRQQNNYSLQVFGLIIDLINYFIYISKSNKQSDKIWAMLKTIQNKYQMFELLDKNSLLFSSIIEKLIADQQFEESLYLLKEYGKLASVQNNYLNRSKMLIFYDFVDKLPKKIAYQMFVINLASFLLDRIGESPRLSFIFLYLIEKMPNELSLVQKLRYIKLISFGLSKINVRYEYYTNINGYILELCQKYVKFKNSRKQLLHLRQQIKVTHKEVLWRKLSMKTMKKCWKLKTSQKLGDTVQDKASKKIMKIQINIKNQTQHK